MTSWIRYRRRQLVESLKAIRGKETLRVAHPFGVNDTPIAGAELIYTGPDAFKDPGFQTDIFFRQGYAPDYAHLVQLRETGRAGILACWFWDNHHLIADSMHAAMLSDVTFYAHYYKHAYLQNELAVDGTFAPLCPIVWTVSEAERAAALAINAPRSNALYGGYNSYAEFPERDILLRSVMAHIPDHALFMTPHGTPIQAHPYYGLPSLDRLLEWMRYKVSLCIAFDGNMAMRLFDALLGGGIPLLVGRPADLDHVISPAAQKELPVLLIEDKDPAAIAAAYRRGVEIFDQGGAEAALRRHRYVLGNHMLHHRLAFMIQRIREIAEKAEELEGT